MYTPMLASGWPLVLIIPSLSPSIYRCLSLARSPSNDPSIEAINAAGFDYPYRWCRQWFRMVVQIKQFIYTRAIKLNIHRTHPRRWNGQVYQAQLLIHICWKCGTVHCAITLTTMQTHRRATGSASLISLPSTLYLQRKFAIGMIKSLWSLTCKHVTHSVCGGFN